MKSNIHLLDCTLRDGEQGIEDLNKNGLKTEVFTKYDRIKIAHYLAEADVDIIELGCIVESNNDTTGFSIYQSVEEVSKYKIEKHHKEQLFVGLYIDPNIDINKIPEHTSDMVDGIRVILRYSELQKSLDYCAALSKKRYKVFIQPMLTMRYSDDELNHLVNAANEMGAYALYFVDSFGYMEEKDIDRIFEFYDSKLNPEIGIGFHAHNNMQMAFENVRAFLNYGNRNRKLIVDSCVIGMGQGAGNMQTELLVPYLNKYFGKKYDLNKILEVCEILKKFRVGEMNTWGYSPIRSISAIHKAAYKYAVAMRLQKNMTLPEINRVFEVMPDDLKHRYTPENLEVVLKLL